MKRDLAGLGEEWRMRAMDGEWKRVVETAVKQDQRWKEKENRNEEQHVGASLTPDKQYMTLH